MGVASDNHHHEESKKKDLDIWSMVKRGVYDVKQMTVITSKNTKEALKIQQAKARLVERKKAFGVEYLDLMERDATEVELQCCIDKAMEDTGRLHEKIERWGRAITENNEKLERKIAAKNKSIELSHSESSSESDSDEESESESEDEEEDEEHLDNEEEEQLAKEEDENLTKEDYEDLDEDDVSIANSSQSTHETEEETEDSGEHPIEHGPEQTVEVVVNRIRSPDIDTPFDEALAALRRLIENKEERVDRNIADYKIDKDELLEEAPSFDETADEDEDQKPISNLSLDEGKEICQEDGEIELTLEEEGEVVADCVEAENEKAQLTSTNGGDELPFDEITVNFADID